MARTISPKLSPILEELELEKPQFVTTELLASLCERNSIRTPPRIVASRLKDGGWLIPMSQRGVWEFAPAELAGAFSSGDPLAEVKAFQLAHPSVECVLSGQTAAWALGLADRLPSETEIGFPKRVKAKVPNGLVGSLYSPRLPLASAKGMAVLPPESIVVHMAERPSSVRSWQSAFEWLPDVAYEMTPERAVEELAGRPRSVLARTGYLLQGMRPDVAAALSAVLPEGGAVKFGISGELLRSDRAWGVLDYVLPFDPRTMEAVV